MTIQFFATFFDKHPDAVAAIIGAIVGSIVGGIFGFGVQLFGWWLGKKQAAASEIKAGKQVIIPLIDKLYVVAGQNRADNVWSRCQKELLPEFTKFCFHFNGKNWKALNKAWQQMEEIAREVPEDYNCTKTHFPNLTQENLECGIANLRDVIFKL
jgi:hypothetical protein